MRIVDKSEVESWLSKRGLLSPERKISIPKTFSFRSFPIPVDTGMKRFLSKTITNLYYAVGGEALLWISEYGIWPSAENLNLFYGFRKSLGEDASLYDEPGHLFAKEDLSAIDSLLCLTLYFFWGCMVAPPSCDFLICVSHDEMVDVFVRNGIEGNRKVTRAIEDAVK